MAASDFAALEERVRAGRLAEVRAELRRFKKIERADLAKFAELARRAGAPGLALRRLVSIVRPSGRARVEATAAEALEYAGALITAGAGEEGRTLLESRADLKSPQSLLFRAFSHFAEWDYGAALPLLEAYVEAPGLSDYQRLIGEVNLLASLVTEGESRRGGPLLDRLLTKTAGSDLARLHANVLELGAQLAIRQGEFREARSLLAKSSALATDPTSPEALFARKWSFLARALDPKSRLSAAAASQELASLRKHALRLNHWETLRDCDLHEALFRKDAALFEKVYRGTPYAAYRERVAGDFAKRFGGAFEPSVAFAWIPEGSRSARSRWSWPEGGAERVFKPGQVPERLMGALLADFYRPAGVVKIFGRVFPERYFHPVYSANLVHQALYRLRAALAEGGVPFEIVEERRLYRLRSRDAGFAVVFGREGPRRNAPESKLLEEIRSRFGDRKFSPRELRAKTKIPERSLQRLLSGLVSGRGIRRTGSGAGTRYQLE
jgi:hypothetical protein